MAGRSGPFDEIGELFDRLARQLETAARSWETAVDDRSRLDLSMRGSATSLDVAEEGEEFVVTVDVPGYETDDLEINLTGETLKIRGERARETDQVDEETYIRRERELRSFSRQVRLPAVVDAGGVDATLNNGVLTIRLPTLESDDDGQTIDIE
ncbi:Hsp20/alpha crystallin family protein [Natrialba sp. INN-245]|uniref:Hsp20/alpha crystallin family protein n=1 Tax=Natrialba sp. INN-245 TaxID=2690967 RepID=UPI001310BA5A|nr:Hsp20/alpha crystallin family protein [Natrialba sp. INN-245]MWV41269.1 Hsp20 family protein [Natrialba sp. INN-245]